jgi:short-subunit dehydrogenase
MIMSHLFAEHMLSHKKQSYMLNVASIAAFETIPKFGTYCGSKKFVKDVTETMSWELKDTNVSVTCLSPGGTYTEFMDRSGQTLKTASAAFMMSASDVARIALDGLFAGKMQVVPGFINWLTTVLMRFVPNCLHLSVTYFFYSKAVDETSRKS